LKQADVSEVQTASIIAQMVEAVGTSETTLQGAVFQHTAERKMSGVLHVLV
jgi:hypothetical protein